MVSASFPADLASAGRAREFVAAACRRWGVAAVLPTAELVVTELVENAVQHSGSACEVVLERDEDTVTITVNDSGPDLPRVLHPGLDQRGGRGLLLVSSLARDWGYRPTGSGKQVWASVEIS